MASGRRDYLTGVSPLKQTTSIEQEYWESEHHQWLDADEFVEYINYVVPVGYKLIITGGLVTASLPALHYFYIKMGDSPIVSIWYDTNYQFPQDQSGIYDISAGKVAVLWCRNMDTFGCIIGAVLYGFLEKI